MKGDKTFKNKLRKPAKGILKSKKEIPGSPKSGNSKSGGRQSKLRDPKSAIRNPMVLLKEAEESRTAISDVTRQKFVEDEIKRFASFPQLDLNPVLEVDSSGVIVFCNAAAIQTLRKLNLRDATIFLPDDIADILKALNKEDEVQFYREVKIKDRIFAEALYVVSQYNSIRIYASDVTERRQAEETLRHSEEYFRLLMENASDAVTILEGDGTIRYESLSVERLLGYKPEELVGTSAFGLIHPADMPKAEDALSQLLQKPGLTLYAEFRCRHKDGSWRILGATGRNFLDHPVIKGIVVNSRDITEHKQAEEALRSERQKLINILDSMVDGVYIVNQQNEIEYVNPLIEKEYGPVNGRKCHEYFEGRKKACTWCKNQEVFKGKTVRSEWYSEKTNKTYDLINTPLKNPDGSASKLGIFRDVTERKQAEEALRAKQAELELIADTTPIVLTRLSCDLRYVFVNQACAEFFGRPRADIVGKPIAEVMGVDAFKTIRPYVEKVLQGEPVEYETEIPYKGIGRRFMHVAYVPERNTHGDVVGWVASVQNISARKQAEEALKKVNRTLRALSNSNQAMLHAKSEAEFLKEVCGIIVEDCGHAMVWIGFAEDNEGKTVRPVASAGFEEGYLETLNITWADTERGRGPTGTAIRTGRPSICRNMLTDPAFEPWREEAINRGYASSIVLPLIADGKAFGAINIYSTEPDPFTEDEVKLLSELAGDLSYGILAMRSRVAHAQAEQALRKSEARYRSYLEVTGQVGWTTDANGLVVEDMPAWRQYTGQSREEIQLWGWAEVLHPDDLERTSEIWQKAVREKRNYETEYRMRRRDGVYRHFLARGVPTFNEDGSIREWVGTCIDITERKQAEERMREAKELGDCLNRINEIISSTFDEQEIMGNVVREAGKAIGCETAAMLLRKDDHWEVRYVFGFSQDLIRTEMVDEQEPHAILALETRKPIAINDAYNDERVNLEHMKKYGVRSVLVVPLFLEKQPFGVIFLNYHTLAITFTDVQIDFAAKVGASVSLAIEKVRLMSTLKLRAAELETANKELEAFSYTVSHDLKTPLRSIQGFAQAITEDYEDRLDDAGRDSLRRINSAGERMTQLIDAMLEISRLTSRDLMNKSVDLSSIAEVITYDLQKKEPDRIVHFIIAKEVRVQGDEDLLEIALRNLFDNAWKFTSKHASAKIEFGVFECDTPSQPSPLEGEGEGGGESEIRNQRSEMEERTVYFVKDDGAGFNMEYADKLFMPFKRLHSASEFPGLGMGLATVKKIINKHSGKIWAEGEPEKGATFYFTLG